MQTGCGRGTYMPAHATGISSSYASRLGFLTTALTQEEFSNHDFFRTGLGCLQGK
jgi:hypothetical protein